MPSQVRTFSDLGAKSKVSIFRDYGWAKFVIANGNTVSNTIDIGAADSIMVIVPAAANTKTMKIQTTYDGTTWVDLVSWTAATGIKVFTDAAEQIRVKHSQVTRLTVDTSVGSEAVIWVSLKG